MTTIVSTQISKKSKVKVEQLTADLLSLQVVTKCCCKAVVCSFYTPVTGGILPFDVFCMGIIKNFCFWFELVSKLQLRNESSINYMRLKCNHFVDYHPSLQSRLCSCERPLKGVKFLLKLN